MVTKPLQLRPDAEFWTRPEVSAALAARDMGALFAILRGSGISRLRLAMTVGLSETESARSGHPQGGDDHDRNAGDAGDGDRSHSAIIKPTASSHLARVRIGALTDFRSTEQPQLADHPPPAYIVRAVSAMASGA